MKMSAFLLGCLAMIAVGCGKTADKAGDTGGAAAAPPACDAVVAKMLSFQPGSGEPEKKLLTAACPSMPPALKSCVVAAKTKAEYDQCGKQGAGQKLVKLSR